MALSKNEGAWRVAATVLSLIALCFAAYVWLSYKERQAAEALPAAAISGKQLVISAESKAQLIALMNKEDLVVGISVVSISLSSNRRTVTFFDSKDMEFKEEYNKYRAKRLADPNVFTQNPTQNSRITSILNGNFECRPTAETVIASRYPADKYAPLVCSMSVPPGFDDSRDFVGYINIFIRSENIQDSDRGRLSARTIAISRDIYHRDLVKDDDE